jgi:hypothetical protein
MTPPTSLTLLYIDLAFPQLSRLGFQEIITVITHSNMFLAHVLKPLVMHLGRWASSVDRALTPFIRAKHQ